MLQLTQFRGSFSSNLSEVDFKSQLIGKALEIELDGKQRNIQFTEETSLKLIPEEGITAEVVVGSTPYRANINVVTRSLTLTPVLAWKAVPN